MVSERQNDTLAHGYIRDLTYDELLTLARELAMERDNLRRVAGLPQWEVLDGAVRYGLNEDAALRVLREWRAIL